ncbi:MAG: MBOAT family O-acyltransferase [Deltaproteobacteria bacterium]
MIFNTWTFGIFLFVFFLVYWFVLKPEWRSIGIVIGSIIFYTSYFPAYTPLIIVLSLFVYGSGLLIEKYRTEHGNPRIKDASVILWLSITGCVLVLGYFKYLKLILSTINDMFSLASLNKSFAIPQILVPLGLSFFIFEFIHYLVDCYHGRIKKPTLIEFLSFAMFFPTLVSGPIKRFQPFSKQLRQAPKFKPEFLTYGVKRIIIGLAKKILIADIIGFYALPLINFSKNPDVGTLALWLAAYAYAIKIYFDFSGYSDIAIGCARLLGFDVPENFNKPYLKQNIGAFWHSWHMSLSSWLRDYIYMPIGQKLMPTIGKKSPLLLAAICQFITMGICGLWHGAYWNFVVWGLFHGMGLTIHKAYSDMNIKIKRQKILTGKSRLLFDSNSKLRQNIDNILLKPFYTLLTFHFVCIGWVFFVLNINDSLKVISKMLFIS